MIFYKCETCKMLSSEYFATCLSCGVYSGKTKEEYIKVKDKCNEMSKYEEVE